MPLENLETYKYRELMKNHILATIEYLFDANQEFGIACDISAVSFSPNLPTKLQKSLPEITLFMLANYSYESASVDQHYLSFEAGFGPDNFGSLVQIPLLAIKQIFVDEYPILINVTSLNEIQEEEPEEEIDSMSALLKNPENAKLLKRKKG